MADLCYGLGDTHAAGSLDYFEQIPLCLAELIERLVQRIHSLAKCLCLAVEHEQKKAQPGFPISVIAVSERPLRGPESSIIGVLVLFDDGLDRGVGHVGVASPE